MRDQKKHHDDEEEDSFSVASSYPFLLYLFLISNSFFCLVLSCQYMCRTATSVRSKVTIGVAPTFRSTSRVERRKEVFGNK